MLLPVIALVLLQIIFTGADFSKEDVDLKYGISETQNNSTFDEEELIETAAENETELDIGSFRNLPHQFPERDSDEEQVTLSTPEPDHDAEEDDEGEDGTVCGAVPQVEGARTHQLEGLQHAVGTEVTYRCDFGYSIQGSGLFRSVCEFNEHSRKAEWTNPNVACVPRSCDDPGFVNQARRIGNLFTFPHSVEFQCEDGYKLKGTAVRYCQASGQWSGRLPTCEQIHCNAPLDPENGRVRYISTVYGSELSYVCNKGFVLKNHQLRYCTEGGTWSNNDPVCIEAACDVPSAPEHGSMELLGDPKVDSIVLYSCDPGKNLVGVETSKCLSTGQWTFPTPKCLSPCVVPTIADGELGRYETRRLTRYKTFQKFVQFQAGDRIDNAGSAVFRCKEGFVPVEESKTSESRDSEEAVICDDGKWSMPLQCKLTSCLDDPPPIDHGYSVVSSRANKHIIFYRCNEHYVKDKPGRVECVYGTWTGYTPVCVEGRCYTNQLNVPGLMKPSIEFISHGNMFEVRCVAGYKPSKRWKRNVYCEKGRWKFPENPCIEDLVPPSSTTIAPSPLAPTTEKVITRTQTRLAEETTRYTIPNKLSSEQPTSQPPQDCFCTYSLINADLVVEVNGRRLRYGDKVNAGDTVRISCIDKEMILTWISGLRVFGPVNLTCETCQSWQERDLPSCGAIYQGDTWIVLSSKMKLLPGGAIKVSRNERVNLQCSNWNVIYPTWHAPSSTRLLPSYNYADLGNNVLFTIYLDIPNFESNHVGMYECNVKDAYNRVYRSAVLDMRISDPEILCPELDDKDIFTINYSNERKANSVARYFCKKTWQGTSGANTRTCLENGEWSDVDPTCVDITCSKFPAVDGLVISYSNERRVGSFAQFSCKPPDELVGSSTVQCLGNGTWSRLQPFCERPEILCPNIDKRRIFDINYSNGRRVSSVARFVCKNIYKKVFGPNTRTCLPSGEWSEEDPACEDLACPPFQKVPGLEVSYSDGNRPLSRATFSCPPTANLVGSISMFCQFNESWSGSQPSCKAAGCPMHTFTESAPQNVIPNMEDVTGEVMSVGSEVRLLCEENLIPIGEAKATCGQLGTWVFEKIQCVIGCHLITSEESSSLIVDPVQDFYRFGEFAIFSCPQGLELTSEVERIMCLGSNWSDSIPDCK